MRKKNITLTALIIAAIVLNIFSLFSITRNIIYHKQTLAQENLICPTPASAQSAIQLLSCFINTPTPTQTPTPSPSLTPPPSSSELGSSPSATQQPILAQQANTGSLSALTSAGTCAPPSSYASIQQSLLANYHINLTGAQDLAWANQAYTTICKLSSSPTFINLLTSQGNVNLQYNTGTCVTGNADMNTGVTITGTCTPQQNRAILIHELTHMIAFRNPSIFNNFLNTVWPAQIPTYNCQIHYGDGPTPTECFADGSAEYVVYSYLRITLSGQPAGNTTFTEYPTTYSNYYNFMSSSLYGNASFTSF